MKRILAGAAVAGAVVLALASPAHAGTCETTNHTNLDDVRKTADADVKLTNRGVRVELPSSAAKVDARFTPAHTTKLADIQQLSYQTKKDDVGTEAGLALPTFQIEVDTDGGEFENKAGEYTTLVFEPYVVGRVVTDWNTWDVETGRFWSTRPVVPGMGAHDTAHAMTLDKIADALPDAVVLAYGVTVGSANTGFIGRFDKVTFNTKDECVTHKWTQPTATESPSPSPSPSATKPAGGAVGGASPTPAQQEQAASLPVTGVPARTIGIAAGALLVFGAVLVVATRRRRTAA